MKAGEYLLAVEGKPLRFPDNLYERFERTANRIVEITVGPAPDGTGSRTVKVVPLEDERALRNRDWVEGNLRRVTEATQGRVAYVYVPNTAEAGHKYFKRYFFPQADRQAIIVDERHNGGGSVADYYIDILRRPVVSYWAMRYGADLKTPIAGIHGPKVMLIDETAGSGGDLLPWMFRKFGLGPLVGKRTWGGLVGILGFPVLMDGGTVTAPNLAIWTEDGFIVENEGVAPDVEVEQTPADVIAGKDPQLEKAIEMVLAELAKAPPAAPKRPPFPLRARPRPYQQAQAEAHQQGRDQQPDHLVSHLKRRSRPPSRLSRAMHDARHLDQASRAPAGRRPRCDGPAEWGWSLYSVHAREAPPARRSQAQRRVCPRRVVARTLL